MTRSRPTSPVKDANGNVLDLDNDRNGAIINQVSKKQKTVTVAEKPVSLAATLKVDG